METGLHMPGRYSVAERIPPSFIQFRESHLLAEVAFELAVYQRQSMNLQSSYPASCLAEITSLNRQAPPAWLVTFQRGFHTHFTGWHMEFQGFYTIQLSFHRITSFQSKTLYLWMLEDQNPAMTGH